MREFRINRKEFNKRIIFASMYTVFVILLFIQELNRPEPLDFIWLISSFSFFILIIIWGIYTVIKRKNRPALILSQKGIKDQMFGKVVEWNDITDLEYQVGFRKSFMKINVIDKYKTLKQIPYLKRGNYLINVWRHDTPLVINLEELEGNPKENFDEMVNFKNSL